MEEQNHGWNTSISSPNLSATPTAPHPSSAVSENPSATPVCSSPPAAIFSAQRNTPPAPRPLHPRSIPPDATGNNRSSDASRPNSCPPAKDSPPAAESAPPAGSGTAACRQNSHG